MSHQTLKQMDWHLRSLRLCPDRRKTLGTIESTCFHGTAHSLDCIWNGKEEISGSSQTAKWLVVTIYLCHQQKGIHILYCTQDRIGWFGLCHAHRWFYKLHGRDINNQNRSFKSCKISYLWFWLYLSCSTHFASVMREVLMFPASFNLSPVFCVFVYLSEPARSTNDKLEVWRQTCQKQSKEINADLRSSKGEERHIYLEHHYKINVNYLLADFNNVYISIVHVESR